MGLNLVMLGPPGAGKGTQAIRLARLWGIPHVSTGAILREAIRNETALGREVKAILDSGALVDDALITRVVWERLNRPDASAGFLLDGYPRTVPQARALDGFIATRGSLVVVEIVLTDAEVLRRLASRMVCSECGVNSEDDRQVQSCHNCGGRVVPRTDDAEEVVRKRLEVYHVQTAPLVEYYRDRPVFRQVNGDQMVDDVTDALVRAIREISS